MARRRTTGLPARTAPGTVPHMFGRHRTTPNHELTPIADALHERLARPMVSGRAEPPRNETRDIRDRLSATPGIGLRERLDRRLDRRLSPG